MDQIIHTNKKDTSDLSILVILTITYRRQYNGQRVDFNKIETIFFYQMTMGLAQAKIMKKSVILFRVLNMTI